MKDAATYRKAFVTSTSPRKVRFEGETAEHLAESLVPVTVGACVWVQLYARTLMVLGVIQ